MREFFRKFFGYYEYIDEQGELGLPEPYKDELGSGAFSDWRHYLLIGLVFILSIVLYKVFRKKKKAGNLTVVILVSIMFIIRVINQMVRALIGAEVPFWRAFPIHLCTVMSFVLPLVVIFNWKKLKTPVYTLSMMGGIITLLLGEYFDNLFLPFSSYEGIYVHTVLILVPIIEIATGNFKFEFKRSWTVFVTMGILLLWATIANEIFFSSYDPNYMYLKENGLPGNLGGDYYFFIYVIVFLLMFLHIYGIPTLYRKQKNNQ